MILNLDRSCLAALAARAFLSFLLLLGSLVPASPVALAAAGPACGDGQVDDGEACDEGEGNSDENGVWCASDCTATPCGSPVSRAEGAPKVTDALFALRAAVAVVSCDARICDVNDKAGVTVADALQILRLAVGLDITLTCPVPVPDVTCVNKTFSSITEVFDALAGDYAIFLDDGSGTTDDVYTTGTLAMRILPNFLGKKFVSTSVNGSTSNGAAYYDDGRAGESWEDLDHEVNVFFATELGTSKILQCDKTTGQLTFVIQVVNGDPGFARLKTPLP